MDSPRTPAPERVSGQLCLIAPMDLFSMSVVFLFEPVLPSTPAAPGASKLQAVLPATSSVCFKPAVWSANVVLPGLVP